MAWGYLLKRKSDAFEAFKLWIAEVEKATGKSLKEFRTDNTGEYISTKWENWMKERGICWENSVPHTPQQNGRAERLNRTIFNRVRTILLASCLPLSLTRVSHVYLFLEND